MLRDLTPEERAAEATFNANNPHWKRNAILQGLGWTAAMILGTVAFLGVAAIVLPRKY